jgi:ribosomal protein S18 acetylase RimI-like enzyme
MNVTGLSIIPYARRHRHDLMNLLQNDEYLHIHLDWSSVDEWLTDVDTPIFLAYQEKRLIGAMAGSPPLDHSAWLRLIAVAHNTNIDITLDALWSALKPELAAKGIGEVAVLALRPWIVTHIERLGFAFHDSIVTLRREGSQVPPLLRSDVKVRHADWREIGIVAAVDHAAFSSIWQLSNFSLQQAARSSSTFTLAELDNHAVGYQISTLYRDGAHLARLATMPELQGTGVGGVLLAELIQYFIRRSVFSVTVNTQKTNSKSLRLYQRFGFDFTGLNMDVWSLTL